MQLEMDPCSGKAMKIYPTFLIGRATMHTHNGPHCERQDEEQRQEIRECLLNFGYILCQQMKKSKALKGLSGRKKTDRPHTRPIAYSARTDPQCNYIPWLHVGLHAYTDCK
jgi:hypothetical protein